MATLEKATLGAGNTKQPLKKEKAFILTLNEKTLIHYEEIKNYILNLKSNNYYLCCEHIGQENKHYHIYCQFTNAIKLSIKKLYGAHIERALGSPKQNIMYLKCEDEKHKKLGITSKLIDEQGEIKLKGGFHTVKEIKEMNEEEFEELPAMYYNVATKIKQEKEFDIDIDDWKKEVEVVWIQGPSGIGKTEKAKKIVRKNKELIGTKVNIVKFENNFWLGIGNAKVAIYDDFRDSHMKPSEFINFIDYNKHYFNTKGGMKINKYELIIITTVQDLKKIYKNVSGEPREQWERRIKIIDMFPKKTDKEIELEKTGVIFNDEDNDIEL